MPFHTVCFSSVGRVDARGANDPGPESVAVSRAIHASRRPAHRSEQRLDLGGGRPVGQGRQARGNLRLDRYRATVLSASNGRHVHETI